MMSPTSSWSAGVTFAYTTDPFAIVPVIDPPVMT